MYYKLPFRCVYYRRNQQPCSAEILELETSGYKHAALSSIDAEMVSYEYFSFTCLQHETSIKPGTPEAALARLCDEVDIQKIHGGMLVQL